MSALDEIMAKPNEETTDLEFAIVVLSEIRPGEAEQAAAELARLQAQIAKLEHGYKKQSKEIMRLNKIIEQARAAALGQEQG